MSFNKIGNHKVKKILLAPLKVIYALIVALISTIIISLPQNIKKQTIFAFKPEEKLKLKRELETKEDINQIEKRVEVLERLAWAIHKDPSYMTHKAGEQDLEKLKKVVKK